MDGEGRWEEATAYYDQTFIEGLASCRSCPFGITGKRQCGEFPRGLHLEGRELGPATGVMIIGKNPGRADALLDSAGYPPDFNPKQYRSADAANVQRILGVHPYYVGLRRLVQCLGIQGPVWWTETMKCQNPIKPAQMTKDDWQKALATKLSSATMSCVVEHLAYQLERLPTEWPIVFVGDHARSSLQRALSDVLADRKGWMVEVPHASGAWSMFDFHFITNIMEHRELARATVTALESYRPGCSTRGVRRVRVPTLTRDLYRHLLTVPIKDAVDEITSYWETHT